MFALLAIKSPSGTNACSAPMSDGKVSGIPAVISKSERRPRSLKNPSTGAACW